MSATVSVIIPTFNRADYLPESIQSVLDQKLNQNQKLEIIVVDDGSTDNTAEIVRKFGDKIRYYRIPHSGLPAVARNFGITKAEAELIALQDSDDLWVSDKLQQQLPAFKNPEVVLCYGNGLVMEANGELTNQLIVPSSHQKSGYVFDGLVLENFISTSTVVARKSVLKKLGGFNEALRIRGLEDYELWLRLTGLRMGEVKAIKKPLVYYRRHEKNISHKSISHPLEDILCVLQTVQEQYAGQLSPDDSQALEAAIYTLSENFDRVVTTSKPLVSVVMSVYNAGDYLDEAIESILNQTYTNFEFIIVDDGSTDNSFTAVESYKDPRLKIFRQKNQGLQSALNFGISQSSGKYVARMDQDDISAPDRIEKQMRLLEKNGRIAIAGTNFLLVNELGIFFSQSHHLDRPEDLKLEVFTRNPFGHGTVMVRRTILDEVGLYNEKELVEDYELWWRILKNFDATNLTEELYSWRVVPTSMSHSESERRQNPIHNLVKKIWQETELPEVPMSQIESGLKHYLKISQGHQEQFKFMLATLCLGAFRLRRYSYASRLFSKLLLSDITFIKTMYKLTRVPFSHNYLFGLIYKS